ncbi:MAG: MBL fold metallo-hydrolase [Arenicella sp.]|nr:MBL fold metallo-hydrolase [Arenicella sp.]
MHPEKSIQAHWDLNADVMFPIHWGTFALSFHDWFEPINLAVEYANQNGVKLVTPKLGQKIEYNQPIKNQSWWKPLEIESREK